LKLKISNSGKAAESSQSPTPHLRAGGPHIPNFIFSGKGQGRERGSEGKGRKEERSENGWVKGCKERGGNTRGGKKRS